MPSLARIEAMLEALVVACIHDKQELADLAKSLAFIAERGNVKPRKRCLLETINGKLDTVLGLLNELKQQGNNLMATQADLTKQIDTLTQQVIKIGGESGKTLQMVTDLQAQLANMQNVDPALQKAVDALAAQIKVVDDMVPDAPPTP